MIRPWDSLDPSVRQGCPGPNHKTIPTRPTPPPPGWRYGLKHVGALAFSPKDR